MLSVVVMGYRNETTIVDAVRSVVEQATDEHLEVVAVVSGDDRSAELLREFRPDVRVVASSSRLLPGGARNAGIAHCTGEIVAFLAGDCVAQPGWIAGRTAAHRAGHDVVAGAVGTDDRAGPLARAELYLLFSTRLPKNPAGPATRPQAHGLSFSRRVLDEIAPFREDVRIGEDTLVLDRLEALGVPVWFEPAIVIRHVGSPTVRSFLHDQHARGRHESGWDRLHGGFPRRWFDSVPWPGYGLLGVLLRAAKRIGARGAWIIPNAWRATPRRKWRLVTAMPALLVGLIARQSGWTADQMRDLRRRTPE